MVRNGMEWNRVVEILLVGSNGLIWDGEGMVCYGMIWDGIVLDGIGWYGVV